MLTAEFVLHLAFQCEIFENALLYLVIYRQIKAASLTIARPLSRGLPLPIAEVTTHRHTELLVRKNHAGRRPDRQHRFGKINRG
jgi:hypothetical protein